MSEKIRGCYTLMLQRNHDRKTETYIGYEQFYNRKKFQSLERTCLLKHLRKHVSQGRFCQMIRYWNWNARPNMHRVRKGVVIE